MKKGYRIVRYRFRIIIAVIVTLAVLINFQLASLDRTLTLVTGCDLKIDSAQVRQFNVSASMEDIDNAAAQVHASPGEFISVLMAACNGTVEQADLSLLSGGKYVRVRNHLIRLYPADFAKLSTVCNSLISDMQYFPVPVSSRGYPWVSYVNSWGNERTYGGERVHEGTDIMACENKAGIYPVLAVCDGQVTNMGWLELGGYRIGITSANGIYYYYAHLASYADGLKTGDTVTAGQLIGFMGNTGYSKVEGTSGKFDVHLHFGIYITDADGSEISLNPYYLLKSLEKKVLYYNYGM
jgi:murein DD-endopeptidase MepM/ murein hydrolase activator NlpD